MVNDETVNSQPGFHVKEDSSDSGKGISGFRLRHFGFLLLLFSTAAAAGMFFLPGGLELRVVTIKGEAPVLVLPMKPGERFTLHYYHSVENQPIWETHSLDKKGTLFIEEERYVRFGAGMGRMAGTGRLVSDGDHEVIEDMHMPTGNFVLRVGSKGVNHTIIWRKTKTNLSDLIPHTAVRFSGRPVCLGYRIYRRLIPHKATPARWAP